MEKKFSSKVYVAMRGTLPLHQCSLKIVSTSYFGKLYVDNTNDIDQLRRNKPNLQFSCANPNAEKISTIDTLILTGSVILGFKVLDLYMEKRNSYKSLRNNLFSDTTFEDIYGLEGAKHELKEVIDFLKEPAKSLS